ncbi:MAG: hypothetical protein PUP93_33185 [Rhizonema sp. NSF051]|nr:hypothetical protein [Rhizonema sp. NSF051]
MAAVPESTLRITVVLIGVLVIATFTDPIIQTVLQVNFFIRIERYLLFFDKLLNKSIV